MKRFLRLPSPAMVVACIALVVAMGGTGYAALTITGKNVKDSSLTGRDVRNNSLTGADVKNLTSDDVRDFSLLANDFKTGQLPAGPQGPKGDPGAAGADGPPGPTASNSAATSAGMSLSSTSSTILTAPITLSFSGRIIASATVQVAPGSAVASAGDCQLRVLEPSSEAISRNDNYDLPATADHDVMVPIVGATTRPAGTYTVVLLCSETAGDVQVSRADLVVMAAAS